MKRRRNPVWSANAALARLALDSHAVIGLRLAKHGRGGAAAQTEARLMVTEKARALVDAQAILVRSLMAGEGGLAPARITALYSRRVSANRRRLAKLG